MRVTFNDIVSARMWAEEHHGADSVLDVYQHKLLELVAESHTGNAEYHRRQVDQIRALMAEIESRFVVEGEPEF
jgi:hypothetical protein